MANEAYYKMRKCANCKKQFLYNEDWVYIRKQRHTAKLFCSWKCLRAYDAQHETKADKIDKALADGLNDGEIKRLLGITQCQLDYHKNFRNTMK